jgi:hypothetical protein
VSDTLTLPYPAVDQETGGFVVRDFGEDLISLRNFLDVSGCTPGLIYDLFAQWGVTIYHEYVIVLGIPVTIEKIKLFELVLFLDRLDAFRHETSSANLDKLAAKRFFRDFPDRPYLSYCLHLIRVLHG